MDSSGAKLSVAETATCGATAGMIARFVTAPFDVIKIRQQLFVDEQSVMRLGGTGPERPRQRTRISFIFKDILSKEGVTAFWKGNIPAEGLYISYSMVQFVVYNGVHSRLARLRRLKGSNNVVNFVSGGLAGGFSTLVTYPLDLLRTRFAAQRIKNVYSSLWFAVRDISTREGIGGFYKGLSTALLQVVPYMGGVFCTYYIFKRNLAVFDINISVVDGLAGALAGIVSKLSIYPLDTLRKRLQVQGPTSELYAYKNIIPHGSGIVMSAKRIVSVLGVSGLYRGALIASIKTAPSTAVTLLVYGRCARFFQSNKN